MSLTIQQTPMGCKDRQSSVKIILQWISKRKKLSLKKTGFNNIIGTIFVSLWVVFTVFNINQRVLQSNKEIMTPLSDEAFAVMAMCSRSKLPYGITVDKIGFGQYKFVWAFKIDQEKAHREGYDAKTVRGGVTIDKEYPGCPHCGAKNFYTCGACGCIVCYHGEEVVICPKCGNRGEITKVDSIDLRGGGY